MMRGAAGLHDDAAGRAVGEEAGEGLPRQALALGKPSLVVGDRQFKDGLGQVDGNGGGHGADSCGAVDGVNVPLQSGTSMPVGGGRSPSHHSSGTRTQGRIPFLLWSAAPLNFFVRRHNRNPFMTIPQDLKDLVDLISKVVIHLPP